MLTPSNRPRGAGTLDTRLGRSVDNEDLLARRIVKQKRAKPVSAATGLVVGTVEVVAAAGTVQMLGGDSNLDYTSVAYNLPYDPNANTDGQSSIDVGDWLTVSGYELTVSAGWYIPVLYVRLIWDAQANAPAGFGPYIQGGDDSVHNDYSIFPGGPYSGGRWGLVQIVNHGPTWMAEGSAFHAEVRPVGGNPTGDSNPSQSALLWDITKLA